MAPSLLSTKFYVPPLRGDSVSRPRLRERILSGFDRPQSFTLLSGPAGSGKTTLLSQVIAHLEQPVAWLSLDEADNDMGRFWTYLLTACQQVVANLGEAALELLEAVESLPDETIPTLLINDLALSKGSLVLVLDDYHLIQDMAIHDSLLFLLDRQPDNLHVVLSTRSDPPWPLARYRAGNRLVEVRARDMQFSREETAEFLNYTMGLRVSAEDVEALEARTEGWIAGLQLAAIAMQSAQQDRDISAFVQAFTGSNLYISEYLLDEVLQRLPEDIQTFLLQTSILDRLNAGLCDAVTDRQDGETMLATLHRANIFLVPLDGEGQWFRYHHLFADLLHARLPHAFPAEAIAALHTRAADWYEQNRLIPQAVNHALAANDFERVARLIRVAARGLIFSGQVNVLRGWLEALPQASFNDHPHLSFYLFWIDILQRKADLTSNAIQKKEDLLNVLPSSPENDRLRGELIAVLCRAMVLAGDTARTIRLGEEALAFLPPDDDASRARVYSALAIAHDLEGRTDEAALAYRECSRQASAAGDHLLAVHTTMAQGLIQCRRGQLHEAARSFQGITGLGEQETMAPPDQAAFSAADSTRTSPLFFAAGPGHIGLASVHLERNRLEAAEHHLQQGMELCRQGGLDGVLIGRMLMSRLYQARGDWDGALGALKFPRLTFKDDVNAATRESQIELARGDVDRAWRCVTPFVEMLNNDPAAFQPSLLFVENPELALARVYVARGETAKAFRILDTLQAAHHTGRPVEVCLLRALAYHKQSKRNLAQEAVANIERALALAESQGHVLPFLEESPTVIPLLQAVVSRQVAPQPVRNYARQLLAALGKDASAPSAGETGNPVESLSPREMEVLQLIAAGNSNQAIADQLFIAVRTVKKHASNVYGKLGVSSRTQAVARARELGLLPE